MIGLAVVTIMRQKWDEKTFSFNVYELFKESIGLSFLNTLQKLQNMHHVYRCLLFTLPGFSPSLRLSAGAGWTVPLWLLLPGVGDQRFEKPSKR